MSDKTKNVPAKPNPQGKGLSGFLLDWERSRPRDVMAKKTTQLLAEYFTSLLVLSSNFGIRPVVGNHYYLYWLHGEWSLSLVSVEEWNSDERRAAYVGQCELHRDMTWTIEPAHDLDSRGLIVGAISEFLDGFVDKLNTVEPLDEALPFYVATFSYHQRILANALSRSMRSSMRMGGQIGQRSCDLLASTPVTALSFIASD